MTKRILVTGATGYIGGRLVPCLLDAGYQVRVMTRNQRHLEGRSWAGRVEICEADVMDESQLQGALADVNVAYYLIHSMDGRADFHQRDLQAARNFSHVAEVCQLDRIVYLGGLGDESDDLSVHLRSRQAVGDTLRLGQVPVTEFRAAMVIGSGSASFEMVRYLTERLPVMVAPRWLFTRTQPIAIDDVLRYLVAAIDISESAGEVIEIGGRDILSYHDMILGYAHVRQMDRLIIRVPVLTPHLSSYWVHIMTPISFGIIRPLIDGLRNEMILRNDRARQLFPDIEPRSFLSAVRQSLDELDANQVESTWLDSMAASWEEDEPYVFTEERGMMIERRKREVDAPPEALFRAFSSLGGQTGWLYLNWLWHLRGLIDRVIGGPGYQRGRRDPDDLRVGDILDFWRVEAVEQERYLLLRAEMKLPGRGWLEFRAEPRPGGGSRLVQTAYFAPKGLFGFLYWYALFVAHKLVFDGMADRITERAGNRPQRRQMFRPLLVGMAVIGVVAALIRKLDR